MIGAIQRAYYLDARNPSDDTTLISLASDLGLDGERFATLLNDDATQATLTAEIEAAQRIGATSFPSLRLQVDASYQPIDVDYNAAAPMLDAIQAALDT